MEQSVQAVHTLRSVSLQMSSSIFGICTAGEHSGPQMTLTVTASVDIAAATSASWLEDWSQEVSTVNTKNDKTVKRKVSGNSAART